MIDEETSGRVIDVSVIIPTYNRRDSLLHCLASLDDQEGFDGRFEVIVVDDGSTDGTVVVLEELKARVRYELIVCAQSRSGSGVARNLGAAAARGSTLLFTDSDCKAEPAWMRKMVLAVRETDGGAAGARVGTPSDATLFAKCFNCITHTWIGGMGSRWRLLGFIPGFRLRTMNMAIPAGLFRSIGGFRPISYGEDTEFSERLASMGHGLIRCRDADILHCEKRTPVDYVLESYGKGRAVMQLLRRGLIPMRGLYFAPLLFFGSLGVFLSLGGQGAWRMVVSSLAIAYLTVLFFYAVRYAARSGIAGGIAVLPIVAILVHIGYALGTVRGLFDSGMPVKGETRPDRGRLTWRGVKCEVECTCCAHTPRLRTARPRRQRPGGLS